jgi:hypothetical protein
MPVEINWLLNVIEAECSLPAMKLVVSAGDNRTNPPLPDYAHQPNRVYDRQCRHQFVLVISPHAGFDSAAVSMSTKFALFIRRLCDIFPRFIGNKWVYFPHIFPGKTLL